MVAVGSLFQHAAIEFQPGQFPIDEALRRSRKLGGVLNENLIGAIHHDDIGAGALGWELILNMGLHVHVPLGPSCHRLAPRRKAWR